MTTPPFLPYGTALTGGNATSWADQILADLGDPATTANVQSLIDWFQREGGGGQNNPLNTTLKTTGYSGSINSVGVASYATSAEGAQADAATIGGGGYPAISAALKSGAGIVGSTDSNVASELSKWSGGGYTSVTGSGTPAPPNNATLTSANSLNPLSGLENLNTFFGDLISADLWERALLMMLGALLILIGLVILAAGPASTILGLGAKTGRQVGAIGRLFGGSKDTGPTEEEKADRARRLSLAEQNTEIGRQKVSVQMMRERRLSGGRHSGAEPNPEPVHSE